MSSNHFRILQIATVHHFETVAISRADRLDRIELAAPIESVAAGRRGHVQARQRSVFLAVVDVEVLVRANAKRYFIVRHVFHVERNRQRLPVGQRCIARRDVGRFFRHLRAVLDHDLRSTACSRREHVHDTAFFAHDVALGASNVLDRGRANAARHRQRDRLNGIAARRQNLHVGWRSAPFAVADKNVARIVNRQGPATAANSGSLLVLALSVPVDQRRRGRIVRPNLAVFPDAPTGISRRWKIRLVAPILRQSLGIRCDSCGKPCCPKNCENVSE